MNSEFAAPIGNRISCAARAEINVITHSSGKIVMADRATDRAVDPSENIAGKNATVSVPFEGEPRLRYHVSMDADDERRLTVGCKVLRPQETRPMEAALAAALRIRPGEVPSVGRVVASIGEYGLNVSLARLPDSSGGSTP